VAGVFLLVRASWHPRPGDPPLLREMAVGAASIVVVLIAGDFLGGGFCYGPRYFIPLMPWLGIATVAAWRNAGRAGRVALVLCAGIALALAIPGAVRYRDLFDRPFLDAWMR
jgi:hypothetical protein